MPTTSPRWRLQQQQQQRDCDAMATAASAAAMQWHLSSRDCDDGRVVAAAWR